MNSGDITDGGTPISLIVNSSSDIEWDVGGNGPLIPTNVQYDEIGSISIQSAVSDAIQGLALKWTVVTVNGQDYSLDLDVSSSKKEVRHKGVRARGINSKVRQISLTSPVTQLTLSAGVQLIGPDPTTLGPTDIFGAIYFYPPAKRRHR